MQRLSGEKYRNVVLFCMVLGFRLTIYFFSALIMSFQVSEGTLTFEQFLSNWVKWDAHGYTGLAMNGYKNVVEICDTCRNALTAKGVSTIGMENGQHLCLVFFPLYPYLVGLLQKLFVDVRLAGMVLSSVSFSIGCVYLYRLVREDYSEETAKNSVIMLALYPFGFFFGAIMTEGLFLFLSCAMLYYIRRHKWWIAIFFGVFATLCRVQGVLLIIPAMLELFTLYRPFDLLKSKNWIKIKELFVRGCSLLLMFLGTGVYLLINWAVEGYPFTFLIYQKNHWHNSICFPTQTLSCVFRNAFSEDYSLQMRVSLWIPEAILAVVCVCLLVYGVGRLRLFLLGYGMIYVLLTYSSTWLISGGRYLACGVPLFVILAIALEKNTA